MVWPQFCWFAQPPNSKSCVHTYALKGGGEKSLRSQGFQNGYSFSCPPPYRPVARDSGEKSIAPLSQSLGIVENTIPALAEVAMRSLAATGATQRVVQQQLETQLLPFPDSLCRAKGLKTTHPEGCDYQFGSRTLQGAGLRRHWVAHDRPIRGLENPLSTG